MATLAKRSKVAEFVGRLGVVIKVAPRDNMMYVKGPPEFGFGYAAVLANVVVALAGGVLLASPIMAAPALVAALPVIVVFATVSFVGAIERTEPFVLAVFDDVAANADGFTTVPTGQNRVAVFVMAPLAAIFSFVSGWRNRKFCAAAKAFFFDGLSLGFARTFPRAKAVLAAGPIPSKFLAAIFTGEYLAVVFNRAGLTTTCRRTKPLRSAVGPELFAASCARKNSGAAFFVTGPRTKPLRSFMRREPLATDFAGAFIHAPIVTQFGVWGKTINLTEGRLPKYRAELPLFEPEEI